MTNIDVFKDFTPDEAAEYGYNMGRFVAAFKDGFERGIADMRAELNTREAEALKEDVAHAKNIEGAGAARDASGSVCSTCWCGSCLFLEECNDRGKSCSECNERNCAPLAPIALPKCKEYEPISADCAACWCRECAEFEECIVDNPEYEPSDRPCPCDGCRKGRRYMPKEAPPSCGKFKSKFKYNEEQTK